MANEWREGTGADVYLGNTSQNTIDTQLVNYIQDPLDRLLANYRQGCAVSLGTVATVIVAPGEVTCYNTGASVKKMRQNTGSTTVTMPTDLDTGTEINGVTYYIYAVADADADTFTCKLSLSNTTPTGVTYYRRLGSVYNDSTGNFTIVSNDIDYFSASTKLSGFGDWTAKSVNVSYLAETDGFVVAYSSLGEIVTVYTDSTNPPSTVRIQDCSDEHNEAAGVTCPVKKGHYWKVTCTSITALNWIPLS